MPGSFLVFKAQRWARIPLRGQRLQPSKLARPGPRPQVPNDLGRTWLARCLQTLALASKLGHRLVIEAIGSGSRCNELFVSPPSQFAASPPPLPLSPASLSGGFCRLLFGLPAAQFQHHSCLVALPCELERRHSLPCCTQLINQHSSLQSVQPWTLAACRDTALCCGTCGQELSYLHPPLDTTYPVGSDICCSLPSPALARRPCPPRVSATTSWFRSIAGPQQTKNSELQCTVLRLSSTASDLQHQLSLHL